MIKRLLLLAIIIIATSSSAMAQNVTVTGTITDSGNTPYSNGSLTVILVNTTGQQATYGGNPNFQKSLFATLSSTGSFTINLPANSTFNPSISPSGTQWNFSYQSQDGYGAANVNVTITGAVDISGTLSGLNRITWPAGNIPPPGGSGQSIVGVSPTNLGWGSGFGNVSLTGAPTTGQVPTATDSTHATWQTPSGGVGTSTAFAGAYYNTTTTVTGVAAPTSPNGVPFTFCSIPAGGIATIPAWCWPGVALNAQTGASYTIAASDRGAVVTDSNVGATAITLPQAGSTNFANNFNFGLFNINTGLVTITPTTSTINGAATQIVPNHWASYIYSDPSNNYRAGTFADIAAYPNSGGNQPIGFTSSTGIFNTISALQMPVGACDATAPYAFAGDTSTGLFQAGAGSIGLCSAGTKTVAINATVVAMGSNKTVYWTNGDAVAGADTGISRLSAGIVAIGTGANGSVAGDMQGNSFISAQATHAATMPVTIGSGTSISSTTLCASASCPAGTYVIPTYLDITTACGTSGTYIVNLIYTDDQGAKTIVVNINGTGSVPATGTLTTTSTANYGENSQVIRLTSGNINYSTTATACGTGGPMVGKLYMVANRVM